MKTTRPLIGLVLAVFVLTPVVAFGADPTPTQADFDACNAMAMAKSKAQSPSASPQTQPGASSGAPQAAPSQEPADKARVENQADQLRGIADASKDDPAYQRAYRDCLKSRGF